MQDEDQEDLLQQQPLSLQDELELSDGGGINGIPTSSLMLPHHQEHHHKKQPETSNYRQIFAKLFTLIRTNTEEEVT